ncbi:MAG: 3-isopropylmalate dehydratase small subunit [Trueperaceae bacterium]|nr:3-isopropylmalate dehydratase small subunit [Trueperaceae bacterium]
MEPIRTVHGRGVVVRGDDIDTDRIIPARYLRCVTFDDLGDALFWDVRHDDDGRPTGHPLDDERFAGASVLISGRNFGCGSSREHAPQSIRRAGFDAVIAQSFGEIFFGNSTTLGLVCIELGPDDLEEIARAVEREPAVAIEIDVEAELVRVGDRSLRGSIAASARRALTSGRYDPLAELLEGDAAIAGVAERLPYVGQR